MMEDDWREHLRDFIDNMEIEETEDQTNVVELLKRGCKRLLNNEYNGQNEYDLDYEDAEIFCVEFNEKKHRAKMARRKAMEMEEADLQRHTSRRGDVF